MVPRRLTNMDTHAYMYMLLITWEHKCLDKQIHVEHYKTYINFHSTIQKGNILPSKLASMHILKYSYTVAICIHNP